MDILRVYLVLFLNTFLFIGTCHTQSASSQDSNVFDMLYQTSKAYGLLPTIYYLSTYTTFYTDAEIACNSLGGYLAEINSPSELNFVKDFIKDDVSEHEFIHINAYRDSNSGPLVSSRGVNLVAIINEEGGQGGGNPHSNFNPLYFDYFQNQPALVQNPPNCLELDKRGNQIGMTTSRCDRSVNRYICEKPLA